MATQRSGSFVLEVAELGKDVLSTFTEFVLSRKVQDHRLETLLATISITTSLLVDLGSTIKKYENDYEVKDEITRPTCETCKADFRQLIKMSKIAKEKGGWLTETPAGGQPIATEVDPWFVFNVTLGQGEKANKFWIRLGQTRESLDALNDTLKYKILKQLNQENRLEPKQIEELKNLTTLVPRMVQTLEKTEKERKARLWLEGEDDNVPKTVKSSRKRPDVGEKDDITKFIEKAETDDSSENTMIGADRDNKIQKNKKKEVKFVEPADDCSSVSSYDSYEKHFQDDTKVIYEEWLLSYHELRSTVRRSWGLFGLKIKEHDEETEYWDIEPELRSQVELKTAHENATSSMTDSKYRSSVEKTIKALPQHARDLIDWLIQDRTEATNNEKYIRQWSVAVVRPKEKHVYRTGKKLVKNVKGRDWLIMIKGETVGKVERTRPDRWNDPWRRSRPRRHYYDRHDEREYVRHRGHYDDYDNYVPPPVPFVGDFAEDDVDDGFRSGLINVGMFSSQGDAEERIDKILDDMTGQASV